MSQMVLPQNFPTGSSAEPARASSSFGAGQEKSGDSRFDAVSRSEQKRLDARESKEAQAAKRAESEETETRQAEKKPAESDAATAKAAESAETREAARRTPDEDKSVAENGEALAAEEDSRVPGPDEAMVESVPVTFAGLQSLIGLTQPQGDTSVAAQGKGQIAGAGVNGQTLPFIQGSMMSVSGLNGAGKPGSLNLQLSGQAGSTSGMALTEAMLTGVAADSTRATESPILQNAIRFQGALEAVNAQASAVTTPKMAPDAPVLRGYATSIDLPVGHAEWGDKVAGKLTWLTARNMSVAQIHLTPPDMGPMEVRVQVQQDQANISVHSANPIVREQLELHSHRLRDMLSEQGLSLEQFDVSDSGRDQDRSGAEEGEPGSHQTSGTGLMAEAETPDGSAATQSLDLTWKGEVDIFA